MKLTVTIKYGIRMLSLLSKTKNRINTRKIAKIMGVSPLYLRQIALPLEKRGFIKSFRGKNGGYALAKSPDKIKIISIFNAYNEGVELSECITHPNICKNTPNCETRKFLIEISNNLKEMLRNKTIADITKP